VIAVTPIADAEPALKLSGIDLHYGFVRALDQIDFQVMNGEVVALLGDNGAGKSSLLKVMSGAHRPTGGTIEVHGQKMEFHSPAAATHAGIQMVYQDLALVEPQDIATNLTLGREILRKPPLGWFGLVDKKAQRMRSQADLDRLGVRTAAMTRPVEMLSGGQRQVVALARSAARVSGERNGIILLDEPTASLDLVGREELLSSLAALYARADAPATMLVTHHVEEIPVGTTHAVLLGDGRSLGTGPIEEVLSSSSLSDCFGLAVDLVHRRGRWSVTAH
jgi:ABC-type sugar transport system ATPase subunit